MEGFPKGPVASVPPWNKSKLLEHLGELAQRDDQSAKHYYDHLLKTGVIVPNVSGAAPKPPSPPMNPLHLLAARLRILPTEGMMMAWPNLDYLTGYIKNDVAIIFIVKGGKPLTIEDDPGLFPSDALVTQLRLLMADPAPTK